MGSQKQAINVDKNENMLSTTLIFILAIYFILLPLIFIACISWIIHQKRLSRCLDSLGIEIDAEIIKRSTHQLPRGRARYITYQFTVANSETVIYIQEQEVGLRHYRSFVLGSHVKVIYLPDNPVISKLSGLYTDNIATYRMTSYVAILGTIWVTILFIVFKNI